MKLLVATDGSDQSDRALAYAIDIANATDGSITIAHTVNPDVYDVGGGEPVSAAREADRRLITEHIEHAEGRGTDILEEAAELATATATVPIETALLYGDPVVELTDYAEEKGFDTIYVGHLGRSRRMELAIGSVAKSVVERATVPVTVVR